MGVRRGTSASNWTASGSRTGWSHAAAYEERGRARAGSDRETDAADAFGLPALGEADDEQSCVKGVTTGPDCGVPLPVRTPTSHGACARIVARSSSTRLSSTSARARSRNQRRAAERAQQGGREAEDEVVGRLCHAAARDRAGRFDRLARPPRPGAGDDQVGRDDPRLCERSQLPGRIYRAARALSIAVTSSCTPRSTAARRTSSSGRRTSCPASRVHQRGSTRAAPEPARSEAACGTTGGVHRAAVAARISKRVKPGLTEQRRLRVQRRRRIPAVIARAAAAASSNPPTSSPTPIQIS